MLRRQTKENHSGSEIIKIPKEDRGIYNEIELLRFSVIKIGNIPWDITLNDILDILGNDPQIKKAHIHVPIDRFTGKTKGESYIELYSIFMAMKLVTICNRKILKGRTLNFALSSYDDLYSAHFKMPLSQHYHYQNRAFDFISEAEALSVINICRNYKAHFSRKCAERPFEHVISCLRLAPWYMMDRKMCDRMFLMACGATDALVEHLSKMNSCISSEDPPLSHMKADEGLPKTPAAIDADFSARPTTLPVPNKSHSQQPSLELLTRLVDSSNTFPAFDANQKDRINCIAAQVRHRCLSMTAFPKTLHHPRGTAVSFLKDILEAGSPSHEVSEKAGVFDEGMKFAFQRIMLSADSDGFEDNTVDKQLSSL